jgi:SAM-dependent methyltransferase
VNSDTVKAVFKSLWGTGLGTQVRLAIISHAKANDGDCPNCGYHGKFRPFGMPVRTGVYCPRCSSLERHRLFALGIERGAIKPDGKDILHFAAEQPVLRMIKSHTPKTYRTSSYPDTNGDLMLDLHDIELPDASVDIAICSHILEHVDDSRAMPELFRILRPGGMLIAMVPIIEGWAKSYENETITSEHDRDLHFGQFDHIRYYGSDFRTRLKSAGFVVDEFTAEGADVVQYRLMRGEKIFLCRKD